MYSSGTPGLPKGCMPSFDSMYFAVKHYLRLFLSTVSDDGDGSRAVLAAAVTHSPTPVHRDAVTAVGNDGVFRPQPCEFHPRHPPRPSHAVSRHPGHLAPDPSGCAAADAAAHAQPRPGHS